MFGAICSGRPIQIAQQLEVSKYIITVPNASHVSHIAVFLLPDTQFVDPNYTALVYFQLPNSQDFKLLGGLNPLKPSAIFKLNNKKLASANTNQVDDIDMAEDTANSDSYSINIGISIEPTPQAEQLLAQEKEKLLGDSQTIVKTPARQIVRDPNDIATLANKIVSHAYNYLGSFIDSSGKVPMKAFDAWWDKFKTKLANNPDFLNTLDSN